MADSGKSPQKEQVKPAYLVALGVVVVAAVIYFLNPGLFGIAPATKDSTGVNTNTSVESTATNNEVVEIADVRKEESSPSKTAIAIDLTNSSRNPFLVPSLYQKREEYPPKTPSLSKPLTNSPVTNGEEETKPDLRLGAIFQKNNDRVALIYYKERGYVLREHDIVPVIGYRIQTINLRNVILNMNNGEHKILQLRSE